MTLGDAPAADSPSLPALDGARPGAAPLWAVRDLGRMAYRPAFEVQEQTHQAVVDGVGPETILLVEHDPVLTVSRRKSAPGHVLADAARLAELGIAVEPTNRGGDVTYHGPGQLVAYPILRLDRSGSPVGVGRYMRWLEDVVIRCAAHYGVAAERAEGATGVWARIHPAAAPEKLCALGVRVRKQVTMHGLALNVDPDLSHFETIVPCGLHGRGVTSLRKLLGDAAPTVADVKHRLIQAFSALRGEL
ncbi:MAG: lipoyl(octanoyl) transferase LipB [Planctomycetota bacterium]